MLTSGSLSWAGSERRKGSRSGLRGRGETGNATLMAAERGQDKTGSTDSSLALSALFFVCFVFSVFFIFCPTARRVHDGLCGHVYAWHD